MNKGNKSPEAKGSKKDNNDSLIKKKKSKR